MTATLDIPPTYHPDLRPASASHRSVRVLRAPGVEPGRILIRCDKLVVEYDIVEVPVHNDFRGRAWQLSKDDGEVYSVLLCDQGHTCECRGHYRHQRCKHVEALLALVDNGRI
jgi:hypothetical protein